MKKDGRWGIKLRCVCIVWGMVMIMTIMSVCVCMCVYVNEPRIAESRGRAVTAGKANKCYRFMN
jgi:hypothetical protein